MIISGNEKKYEQVPTGSHMAICISLIDIGTQRKEHEGHVTYRREVRMAFELPYSLIQTGEQAGKPHILSMFYTMSLGEKAKLRAHLKNWRGKDFTPEQLKAFDLRNVLGKACMVSAIPNSKGKSVIGGIMAIPKGIPKPAPTTPIVYFSLDNFDQAVFDSLSEGIKNMIKQSPEYQEIHHTQQEAPDVPDVIYPDEIDQRGYPVQSRFYQPNNQRPV